MTRSRFPGAMQRVALAKRCFAEPDRNEHRAWYGPGSAAHQAVKNGPLRCVRGTSYTGFPAYGIDAVSPPSTGSAWPLT